MGLLRKGANALVIGHRGASADTPENTMEAFSACWNAGVTWIETDVQHSADLVPMLIHDNTVDRTTNGTGPVHSLTVTELHALDAGSWFNPAFSSSKIPTLHRLLSTLPLTSRVLLEVKGDHTPAELVAQLAVIRATDTTTRVWLQSYQESVLRTLHRALPTAWRGLLRDDIDQDPVAACRAVGAQSYNPDFRALLVRPDVVRPLHEAGISLLVYTADAPDDWARLTRIGVDGIITNRPAALLAWQREHPAAAPPAGVLSSQYLPPELPRPVAR